MVPLSATCHFAQSSRRHGAYSKLNDEAPFRIRSGCKRGCNLVVNPKKIGGTGKLPDLCFVGRIMRNIICLCVKFVYLLSMKSNAFNLFIVRGRRQNSRTITCFCIRRFLDLHWLTKRFD